MKTTTKRTAPETNPHDAANAELDAAMTESEKGFWKRVGKEETTRK